MGSARAGVKSALGASAAAPPVGRRLPGTLFVTPPSGPGTESLLGHAVSTLRLAAPVMVGRAGILTMVAVDTAMTGHAGGTELAFYALGLAPQLPIVLVGIGLLMGTVVLTGEADGAGRQRTCGTVWRLSVGYALALGVVAGALVQFGDQFLLLIGQPPALAAGSGRVLDVLGWGLPAMLGFAACTLFLEGIHRPMPGMVVMLLANVLNAVLNWLFIFGHWGFEPMGAVGAALSTTLVRWFMLGALVIYVLRRVDNRRYGVTGPLHAPRETARRLRRIGYAMGVSHGLESGAFAAMTLFAGMLGPEQVAGYSIAMNLVALAFMCAVGVATAASVRVANAVGRGDPVAMRRAGWVAVGLAALMLGLVAVVFLAVPEALAGIYTAEAGVAAVAVPAIGVAALILVPDGAQAVLMGALRGASDVWPASVLYLLAFWVLMVPLGYAIGVVQGGGATALMLATGAGCAAAAVFLGTRFHLVARRQRLS